MRCCKLKKILSILCVCLLCFSLFGCTSENVESSSDVDVSTSEGIEDVNENSSEIEDNSGLPEVGNYLVTIDIADYGVIEIELYGSVAPLTVTNFVNLVNDGFYDGLTFHRIIDGFMIQGGDPLGNGMGGSENTIIGEFVANGIDNTLSHKRGVISMARSQDFNSASSQFFIVHEDSTFLDGQYAAFGEVVSGMDVVDAICDSVTVEDDNGTVLKENQPVISSITVEKVN